MDPVSPFLAMAAITSAVITTFILAKKFGAPPSMGRFASIDGLRGFLAFFVFLHHSCVWYFYLQNGKWEVPPSNLYTHFGQSSVALFFMITGFLFFSKLIDGRQKGVDWGRLFVSRFLRLVPLYFFAMALMFLIVFTLSHWELNESLPKLLFGMVRWLAFTIVGAPGLNGVENTGLIVAGVTWSLPCEWIFYFSLPLLALTVGVRPPFAYFWFSAIGVALIAWHPGPIYLTFFGGVASAFLVRMEWVRKVASHWVMSFLAVVFLVSAIFWFPSAYQLVPMLLLTGFFAIVAMGNSLFGLLINPVSRTLGEFAYGIYLMHGIVLFIVINFILGVQHVRSFSVLQYWSMVVCIAPVLIFCCFLTYKFIEHPAMQKTTSLTAWLRSSFARIAN